MGKQARAALIDSIAPTVTRDEHGVLVSPNVPQLERRFSGYRIGSDGEVRELSGRAVGRGGSELIEVDRFTLRGRERGGKARQVARAACLELLVEEMDGRAKSFADLCDNSSLAYNLAVSERGRQLVGVAPIVAVAVYQSMQRMIVSSDDRDQLLATPLPELAAAALSRRSLSNRMNAVLDDQPRTFMSLDPAAIAYCKSGDAFFALAHRGNDLMASVDTAKRVVSLLLHQRSLPEPLRVAVDRVRQADTIEDWKVLHELVDVPPLFYAYLRNPVVARREVERYFAPAVRDGYGNDVVALATAVKGQLVDTFRRNEGRDGAPDGALKSPTRLDYLARPDFGWSFSRWCRDSRTFHREIEARMAQQRAAEAAEWAGVRFTRTEEIDGLDLGDGMTVRQLLTADDLDRDGAVFRNCAYSYKSRCANGEAQVFVVDKVGTGDNIPIAMFELSRTYTVRQVEGHRYARLIKDIRDAIRTSVAEHKPSKPYVGVFETRR